MAGTESRPSKHGPGGGFAALPLARLDALLILPLSKRELLALLLVARLTHGCRGSVWAQLRKADLAAVGIGPSHAKGTLEGLLRRGLLEADGKGGYRLGTPEAAEAQDGGRRGRLRALIARHLPKPSRNGNTNLPKSERNTFPKGERLDGCLVAFRPLSGPVPERKPERHR